MRIHRHAAIFALAVSVPVACSVLGDDSGRIELPVGGSLQITPSCIPLPLPASSMDLSVVSVPVVVFARDRDRRPAESLSVSVSVGECPDSADASVATDGAAAGSPGQTIQSAPPAATCGSRGQLDAERWSAISIGAMVGDSSCTTDGAQRLSCSLSANGTATFQVFRNSTAADLAEMTVPLCFQAPAVNGIYSQSANVVLSPNAVIAAGQILVNLNGQVAPATANSCSDLACLRGTSLDLTLLANALASAADPSDGGAGAPSSDDHPVVAQSTLHALLDVRVSGSDSASAQSVRTVLGTDCNAAPVTQVEIPVDALSSQVFSVCTSGAGGPFDVHAVLLEDQRVIGTRTVTIPDALRKVDKAPAPNGGTLVTVSMCGGVPASNVTVSPGVMQSSGVFQINGPTPADSGVTDAAPDPGMSSAGADSGMSGAGPDADAGVTSSVGGASSTGGAGNTGGSPNGPASARVAFAQGPTVQECQEALP